MTNGYHPDNSARPATLEETKAYYGRARRVRRLLSVIAGRMLQATIIPILLWLTRRLER